VKDGEQLRERVQEGKVGLKENVTELNCKNLGLEDLFEGIEATDEFYLGGVMVDTAEYDMLLCVAFRPVCGTRVGCAWAYGDVFGSWAETVQVVCIKTVCNCEAEEGRSDEMMAHSDGALYARRGFATIRGRTGNVRGMVGRSVVHKDFLPHSLFGWGIVI
jgi:hypothetical protein